MITVRVHLLPPNIPAVRFTSLSHLKLENLAVWKKSDMITAPVQRSAALSLFRIWPSFELQSWSPHKPLQLCLSEFSLIPNRVTSKRPAKSEKSVFVCRIADFESEGSVF